MTWLWLWDCSANRWGQTSQGTGQGGLFLFVKHRNPTPSSHILLTTWPHRKKMWSTPHFVKANFKQRNHIFFQVNRHNKHVYSCNKTTLKNAVKSCVSILCVQQSACVSLQKHAVNKQLKSSKLIEFSTTFQVVLFVGKATLVFIVLEARFNWTYAFSELFLL